MYIWFYLVSLYWYSSLTAIRFQLECNFFTYSILLANCTVNITLSLNLNLCMTPAWIHSFQPHLKWLLVAESLALLILSLTDLWIMITLVKVDLSKQAKCTVAGLVVPIPFRSGSVRKTIHQHLKLSTNIYNCWQTVKNLIQSVLSFITVGR